MTHLEKVLAIWAAWPIVAAILAPIVGRAFRDADQEAIERAHQDTFGTEAPSWLVK